MITDVSRQMITVIGCDGSPLTADAEEALAGAQLVVGGQRHLDAYPVPAGARRVVVGQLMPAIDQLAAFDGPAAVLASGDPGFFGVVRVLHERRLRYRVLPAVSSVAQLFARLGQSWDDAVVVSVHGRDLRPAANACRSLPKVAVLTAPRVGPAELAAELDGVPRTLFVGERLGTPQERVERFSADATYADPNVVVVLADDVSTAPRWLAGSSPAPAEWALPESTFEHRDSMVTKREVRALALARLGPGIGRCVWDIGAGSGSVAIECARFGAHAIAIERDEESCDRIRENARRHGVDVRVIEGSAPDALAGLPLPDAVFVGGGGLPALAGAVERAALRIVATFVSLDRVLAARKMLVAAGYTVDGVELGANRFSDLPDGAVRLAATNPVFVLWGIR